jgi:hypothetical protein
MCILFYFIYFEYPICMSCWRVFFYEIYLDGEKNICMSFRYRVGDGAKGLAGTGHGAKAWSGDTQE